MSFKMITKRSKEKKMILNYILKNKKVDSIF